MIAVDTNILARFYCDDPDDPDAVRQMPVARRGMVESESLCVPLTVILEFEWVMRGFHEAEASSFCNAVEHQLGMRHVTVERWEAVKDAIDLHRLADALRWATSASGSQLLSFNDRGFVRRVRVLTVGCVILLIGCYWVDKWRAECAGTFSTTI
jgi:predicted nucleic-acid-binding protein